MRSGAEHFVAADDPRYLLWTIEELVAGNVVNRIQIDDEDRAPAKLAIERMLAL